MAKRAQQESGEERVTAKSRPMMNLTARTLSFVSSSASSNPGRTSYGYQDPGKSVLSDDRTGKPVEVKMEDAHKVLKIQKSECPDIWIRLPRHKWPKSWSSMEDPVVPLERNLYGHPLAGLLWERQFEKVLLKHGWEKIPNWECLFVHREKGLSLSVYVDDIKNWLERNKILIRCGKY